MDIKTSYDGKIPSKLNFGCGKKYMDGWFNVDGGEHLDNVDYRFRFNEFPYPLNSETFDEIIMSHVLEHISWRKQLDCLKELYRVSKKNGTLYIEVPDFETLIDLFKEGFADSEGDYFNVCLNRTQPKSERFLSILLGSQCYDEDFHIGTLWLVRLKSLILHSGWELDYIKRDGITVKAKCLKR